MARRYFIQELECGVKVLIAILSNEVVYHKQPSSSRSAVQTAQVRRYTKEDFFLIWEIQILGKMSHEQVNLSA